MHGLGPGNGKIHQFFQGVIVIIVGLSSSVFFFFGGGGGKYSLSFIHYTCHSGFHFTQTSQGKTLKDGRIHGILLHHIRFKSVLGGILFGGSISKSSPCHNKLTTPPGFSPPALLSLGLKNQKKPTGLDGVGFFSQSTKRLTEAKRSLKSPRWWFQEILIFSPLLGEMMQFDSFNIFSDGLKIKPTMHCACFAWQALWVYVLGIALCHQCPVHLTLFLDVARLKAGIKVVKML